MALFKYVGPEPSVDLILAGQPITVAHGDTCEAPAKAFEGRDDFVPAKSAPAGKKDS